MDVAQRAARKTTSVPVQHSRQAETPEVPASNGNNDIPVWDCDCRELFLGGELVKRFKVPASNQELLLAAFAEQGWPRRIDDPLPKESGLDPKRRLNRTIESLNRKQKNRLIRFCGDGTGEGVCWEPIMGRSWVDRG